MTSKILRWIKNNSPFFITLAICVVIIALMIFVVSVAGVDNSKYEVFLRSDEEWIFRGVTNHHRKNSDIIVITLENGETMVTSLENILLVERKDINE